MGSDGALNAVGTAASPILLTGQTQSPAWWVGVRFEDSNSPNNVLQYMTIEYGGYSSSFAADLGVSGTSRVAISHCTLRDSGGFGFGFYGDSTISFDSNTVTGNTDGAGEIDPPLVGSLTTTSAYTGNTNDVLWVTTGYIGVDQTWQALGVPYMLENDLTVDHHLTIQPGVTLVFPAGFMVLDVDTSGSLTANGTATSPILFTCVNKSPAHGSACGSRTRIRRITPCST